MPMLAHIFQPRTLIEDPSCYRKSLRNWWKIIRLATHVVTGQSSSEFTTDMERLARGLLQERSKPPCRDFPAWDASMDGSTPFQLYYELDEMFLVLPSNRDRKVARFAPS